MKIILVALMLSSMIIAPALSGISSTYAFVAAEDDGSEEDASDLTDAAAIAAASAGLIKALFCPNTPQNRCKHGVCSTGACISFRSSCGTLGSGC